MKKSVEELRDMMDRGVLLGELLLSLTDKELAELFDPYPLGHLYKFPIDLGGVNIFMCGGGHKLDVQIKRSIENTITLANRLQNIGKNIQYVDTEYTTITLIKCYR